MHIHTCLMRRSALAQVHCWASQCMVPGKDRIAAQLIDMIGQAKRVYHSGLKRSSRHGGINDDELCIKEPPAFKPVRVCMPTKGAYAHVLLEHGEDAHLSIACKCGDPGCPIGAKTRAQMVALQEGD